MPSLQTEDPKSKYMDKIDAIEMRLQMINEHQLHSRTSNLNIKVDNLQHMLQNPTPSSFIRHQSPTFYPHSPFVQPLPYYHHMGYHLPPTYMQHHMTHPTHSFTTQQPQSTHPFAHQMYMSHAPVVSQSVPPPPRYQPQRIPQPVQHVQQQYLGIQNRPIRQTHKPHYMNSTTTEAGTKPNIHSSNYNGNNVTRSTANHRPFLVHRIPLPCNRIGDWDEGKRTI